MKRPVDSTTTSTPRSLPGQLGRVALGEHLDLLAVDGDRAVAGLDRARERPQRRVVLEQVGERVRVGDVVHRHELEVEPRSQAARKKFRPMRPKPLIPTFTDMRSSCSDSSPS